MTNPLDPETKKKIIDTVRAIRSKMQITKVVATRSVKGRGGDTFLGYSAAWNTVQEDGGQDLLTVGDDAAHSNTSMTLHEAKIAGYLLARDVDIAAHRHAMAGGSIDRDVGMQAIKDIVASYDALITAAVTRGPTGSSGAPPQL